MEENKEEVNNKTEHKSALKKPNAKPKPKQNITYDSILENMGMCVYDDQLTKLAKQADSAETVREIAYPHVNKKPKNIPQNGYIYNKYNKYIPNNRHQQSAQIQLGPPPTQQQPMLFTPPSASQTRNQLIRTIVQNVLAKKQTPTQSSKTLILY